MLNRLHTLRLAEDVAKKKQVSERAVEKQQRLQASQERRESAARRSKETPAVNWGVPTYIPCLPTSDPFDNPKQAGLLGWTEDKTHILSLTPALVERLVGMGVLSVRLFIVTAGGAPMELDTPVAQLARIAERVAARV